MAGWQPFLLSFTAATAWTAGYFPEGQQPLLELQDIFQEGQQPLLELQDIFQDGQ